MKRRPAVFGLIAEDVINDHFFFDPHRAFGNFTSIWHGTKYEIGVEPGTDPNADPSVRSACVAWIWRWTYGR